MVYADHRHGDLYGSSGNCQGQWCMQIIVMETCMDQVVTAKAKGVYRSSSWSHMQVKWYRQGQGCIKIIVMQTRTGEVVSSRPRVYICIKFYAHYMYTFYFAVIVCQLT